MPPFGGSKIFVFNGRRRRGLNEGSWKPFPFCTKKGRRAGAVDCDESES